MAGYRGRPILTMRLGPEIIAALKISARRHGLTVSDLIRQLIDDQLTRDGISTAPRPLPGQRDIDDYLIDAAAEGMD